MVRTSATVSDSCILTLHNEAALKLQKNEVIIGTGFKMKRLATAVAVTAFFFSAAANAEMMRAFWAGDIRDAVSGNPMALAVGDQLIVEMNFDSEWLVEAPHDVVAAAQFHDTMPAGLENRQPVMLGEIHFLSNLRWEAMTDGEVFASGRWDTAAVQFAPRVVPIPAALPLLVGALGLLAGMRRKA